MANLNQREIFGHFKTELPSSEEYLNIGFSPGRQPLKKRWENNGLSADFIADYFTNFHLEKQENNGETFDEVEIENLRDTVKYIANELLENAMKFQEPTMPTAAKIMLSLYNDEIVFSITNGISHKQMEIFRNFVKSLIEKDPHEVYFEVMKSSAQEENATSSGMGLLSMICDYGAQMGWSFESIDGDDSHLLVTTMASLNL